MYAIRSYYVFRVKGLIPNANYRITELNMDSPKASIPCNGKVLSGSLLMNRGIEMEIRKPMDSGVFLLTKVE